MCGQVRASPEEETRQYCLALQSPEAGVGAEHLVISTVRCLYRGRGTRGWETAFTWTGSRVLPLGGAAVFGSMVVEARGGVGMRGKEKLRRLFIVLSCKERRGVGLEGMRV